MIKNTFFNNKMKKETKTTTAVIKNDLKYFLVFEGNTWIADPNIEVLP